MKIIVDTNILLATAMDEPEKPNITRVTLGMELLAPEVLPFEIGNAISALLKKRIITSDEALSVWKAAQQIPVELIPVDIELALKIAIRFNIYAYDAYFLQCAVEQGIPLFTLDRKMKDVASNLNIEIME